MEGKIDVKLFVKEGINRNLMREIPQMVGNGAVYFVQQYVWDRVLERLKSSSSRPDFFNTKVENNLANLLEV